MKLYSYLALGDSYTIGEQVGVNDSFPYQTVYLLKKKNILFAAPEILAATGFTTDELNAAIDKAKLLPQYDFVSLLIGVNNQYRGRGADNFKEEFGGLLKRAISFSENKPQNVFVLSIPDWGVTPFAANRDKEKIAITIDAFNEVCKSVSEENKTHFIDITFSQREDGNKAEFLAADQLHPSRKEYTKWAALLGDEIIKEVLKCKG